MALMGGTLPRVWLAHATSGHSVTKQPHLSPQHYELNEQTARAGSANSIG